MSLRICAAALACAAPVLSSHALEAPADRQTIRIEAGSRSLAVAPSADTSASARIAFAQGSATLTPAARQAAKDLRAAFARPALDGKPFAVLVSGGDPALAYARARAIRAALLENRGDRPETVVAASLADQAADAGSAAVRFVALDASACAACDPAAVRTIALDGSASRLIAARFVGAGRPAAQPAAAAAFAPTERTTAVEPRIAQAAGDCRRPAIVLDDYWLGGPIRPCPKPRTRAN